MHAVEASVGGTSPLPSEGTTLVSPAASVDESIGALESPFVDPESCCVAPSSPDAVSPEDEPPHAAANVKTTERSATRNGHLRRASCSMSGRDAMQRATIPLRCA